MRLLRSTLAAFYQVLLAAIIFDYSNCLSAVPVAPDASVPQVKVAKHPSKEQVVVPKQQQYAPFEPQIVQQPQKIVGQQLASFLPDSKLTPKNSQAVGSSSQQQHAIGAHVPPKDAAAAAVAVASVEKGQEAAVEGKNALLGDIFWVSLKKANPNVQSNQSGQNKAVESYKQQAIVGAAVASLQERKSLKEEKQAAGAVGEKVSPLVPIARPIEASQSPDLILEAKIEQKSPIPVVATVGSVPYVTVEQAPIKTVNQAPSETQLPVPVVPAPVVPGQQQPSLSIVTVVKEPVDGATLVRSAALSQRAAPEVAAALMKEPEAPVKQADKVPPLAAPVVEVPRQQGEAALVAVAPKQVAAKPEDQSLVGKSSHHQSIQVSHSAVAAAKEPLQLPVVITVPKEEITSVAQKPAKQAVPVSESVVGSSQSQVPYSPEAADVIVTVKEAVRVSDSVSVVSLAPRVEPAVASPVQASVVVGSVKKVPQAAGVEIVPISDLVKVHEPVAVPVSSPVESVAAPVQQPVEPASVAKSGYRFEIGDQKQLESNTKSAQLVVQPAKVSNSQQNVVQQSEAPLHVNDVAVAALAQLPPAVQSPNSTISSKLAAENPSTSASLTPITPVNGGLGPLNLLAETLCNSQPDRLIACEELQTLYGKRASLRKSIFDLLSLKFTNLEKLSSRLSYVHAAGKPSLVAAPAIAGGSAPSHGWPVVGKCTAHDLKLMAEAAWCDERVEGLAIVPPSVPITTSLDAKQDSRTPRSTALASAVPQPSSASIFSKVLHVSDASLASPSSSSAASGLIPSTPLSPHKQQQPLLTYAAETPTLVAILEPSQRPKTRECRRKALRLAKALFNHLAEDQKELSESWPSLYGSLAEDECARKRVVDIVSALSNFRGESSSTIRRDNVEFAFAMDDLRPKVLESEVTAPLTFDRQFIEVEQFLQQSVKLLMSNIDPERAKLTQLRYRSLMAGPVSADDQCVELHQRLLAKNYPSDCNPNQFGQLTDVLRMSAMSLELWSVETEIAKVHLAVAPPVSSSRLFGLPDESTAQINPQTLRECIASLVVT